jgi:hypothetical protein
MEYPVCQRPCSPEDCCQSCEYYWDEMRRLEYWVDGEGWTEKAMREWKDWV